MSTDTVSDMTHEDAIASDPIVENLSEPVETEQSEPQVEKEERVPLSALQKERRKRQEIEQEYKWFKEQQQAQMRQAPVEPDDSLQDAATKEDLSKAQQNVIRAIEERNWIKQNPEKAEEINEKLAHFLKTRPNLAPAIEAATNRYEEAWELMNALTPKQKSALRAAPPAKKDAPGSPNAAPKAAILNQVLDFSSMTDAEYNSWRAAQRKRR